MWRLVRWILLQNHFATFEATGGALQRFSENEIAMAIHANRIGLVAHLVVSAAFILDDERQHIGRGKFSQPGWAATVTQPLQTNTMPHDGQLAEDGKQISMSLF